MKNSRRDFHRDFHLVLSIRSKFRSKRLLTHLSLQLVVFALFFNPGAAQIVRDGAVELNHRPSYSLHGTSLSNFKIVDHTPQIASVPLVGGQQSDQAPAEAAGEIEFKPDRVLVAFKESVGGNEKLDLLRQASQHLVLEMPAASPFFDIVRITDEGVLEGLTVNEAIARLEKDPRVRVAEPDYVVRTQKTIPNDPYFSKLWGLENTGSTPWESPSVAGADISATEAWDLTTGSSQVVVAVIDTGVDYNHPDLAANILRNSSNKVVGYDYVNKDADPMDDDGHGTHCAGTIGAVGNNGVGVVGVAWNVKIMPLKFLNAGGSGYTSDAILCVDYAISHGAHVLSNSWGGWGFSQLLLEAIRRAEKAGVLFIAAAGNSAYNIDLGGFYPAGYNLYASNVISVAATDYNDLLASFSNYGPKTCDIAAPGVYIYSTYPGNQYVYMSGTSMATPHAAGAFALIKSRFPDASMSVLKARLFYSTDHPASIEGYTRRGRLNVFTAMESDTIPPGMPANFAITHASTTGLRLVWTASGEDQASGTVSAYEVLYNTVPDMSTATVVEARMNPGPPGTQETYDLSGLLPQTVYYVGLRAVDKVGTRSPVAIAPPVLTNTASFYDNVESTPMFSAYKPYPGYVNTWGVTTEAAHSGSHSYTDSPGTMSTPNIWSELRMLDSIKIVGQGYIKFWAKTDLEPSYGYFYYQISTDGGNNWQYFYLTDGVTNWTEYEIALTPYIGMNIKLGFSVYTGTNTSTPRDGVYIDDIQIIQLTRIYQDNVEGPQQFTGFTPWSVTTEASVSPTHCWSDSPYSNYNNNVRLPLMQNSSVSTSGYDSLLYSFSAKIDLENYRDYLEIYASPNEGSNWDYLGSLTGKVSDWNKYAFSIAGYKKARLLFFLTTNEVVTGDGVYLDDIEIWGDPFTQQAGCTYSISPSSQSFGPSGGAGSASVSTESGCNWTATNNAAWITIISGSSGTGNGTVNYSVSANTSTSSRTGTMTIAGQTFNVNQSGTNCISSVPSDHWRGEYFNNKTLSGSPVMVRDDGTGFIDFNWGMGSPCSECGLGSDNFSVRWTRTIYFNGSIYRFTVTSDDGFRLYVDDQLILDKWFDQPPTTYEAEVSPSAGDHTIKMEYYEAAGGALASLSWKEVGCIVSVPQDHWKGEYFNNKTLSGSPVMVRDDGTGFIDFNWGVGSPGSECGVEQDNFSVRWTRTINFGAGTYHFTVTSDDGLRLYIDDYLILDKWLDQPPTTYTVDVPLSAGNHSIKMEYYEAAGGAVASLTWTQVGQGSCIVSVPSDHWKGEYFNNRTLSGSPSMVRDDGTGFIDFEWGAGSPSSACGIGSDNFSVSWTRTVYFDAGTYHFTVTSDDGCRLYVDGQPIFDKWFDQAPTTYEKEVSLSAGYHTIEMEYYEAGGGAVASLSWYKE